MMSSPTVFLVDDDAGARDSFSVLMRAMGFQTQAFASAVDFLDSFDPERAGCVVLDVRMPEMSGLELQQKLAERDCPLPIIMLTGHADVPMCAAAFRNGACDFLEKPVNDRSLRQAIERALQRNFEDRAERARRAERQARLQLLTPREREVAELLVAGTAMKQIAQVLQVSNQTVAKHRARVLQKLRASSDVELAEFVRNLR